MTTYNQTHGAIPFSDTGAQINLSASTELTYTVPGDASVPYICNFKWPYNANVWVGYNVTAILPTSNSVTSGYNLELNPTSKTVKGGDVLHFKSTQIVSDAGLFLLQLPY